MRRMWISVCGAVLLGGISALAQQPGMAPGGGERPLGGDRNDEQRPELGSGNRGSGLRGSDRSINPARIRKDATPGTVEGDVLEVDGRTYVVRDKAGNEITLRTDADTRVDGVIRIGGHVIANVERNGRIASVRSAR